MGEEKRRSVRHPVCVNIDTFPDPIPIGRLMNISTEGLFVQTTNLREVGTTIDLCFTLPNSPKRIRVSAEVVWVNYPPSPEEEHYHGTPDRYVLKNPGMGLRFTWIAPEDKLLIEKFIKEGAP